MNPKTEGGLSGIRWGYLEKPSKEVIARALKKALALNGTRRYLIPDFPE